MNINDVLQNSVGDDDDDVVNTLPPHQRCASHTLNLVSCTDVDKWILSTPATKAIYRSATTKCTALWNKASRSTVAAETVDDVIAKKLLVPCTTRWNSFYDALARICEIPIVELNTISSKFGLKAITEREHQFLKEDIRHSSGRRQLFPWHTPTHAGDIDVQDPGPEEWSANPR